MNRAKQIQQTLPILACDLKGSANAQWHVNGSKYAPCEATYRPLNCGEEAFREVYQAIAAARHCIDIICWGFQPSMFFIRDGGKSLMIGQLLEQKAKQGVSIKILGWDMSPLGLNVSGMGGEANLPGVGGGLKNRNKVFRLDDKRSYSKGGQYTSTDAQFAYDQYWFATYMDTTAPEEATGGNDAFALYLQRAQLKKMNAGKKLRFHGRGFSNFDRGEIAARMERLSRLPGQAMSDTQKAALAAAPSHHQKSVLVDYVDPERAIGFVMGHNMLDEYWDTEAHHYLPKAPDAGRNGYGPRQDISAMVSGPVLWYLHDNFVKAWQHNTDEDLAAEPARQRASQRYRDTAQACALLRHDKGQATMAQVFRTQPQEKCTDIARLYFQAVNNATRLIYIENQYFRWLPLAEEIKQVAQNLVRHGAHPGQYGDLYLFVVTNSDDDGVGKGTVNTYKMLDSLGRADTIPNVARSQEIDWRKQQLEQAKAKQARLESQVNRSAAHYPRVNPGHEALLKQVNEARDEVVKAKDALQASRVARDAAQKRGKEQTIQPQTVPGLKIHLCTLVAPDSPGYQPDVYRPTPANPRQTLAMRYDPQADPAPRQLVKNTTWVPVYVHSKLMIVDDVMITNGSANLNVRSMEVDSELNIMSPNAKVARAFRQRLWKQHTTGHFGKKITWGLADDVQDAYDKWSTLIQKNKDAQKWGKPPEASLVEFFRDSPDLSDLD